MNDTASQCQFLTFFVAGEEYAVPILRVKEIIEYSRLTRIPGMPPHIRGVINLRGSVVPVLDLAVRFGFAPSEVSRTSCIVITESAINDERLIAGVIADSVRHVVELAESDIEPPPAFGMNATVEFVTGMGLIDRNLVLMVDLDRVLSATEIEAALDAALQPMAEPQPMVELQPMAEPPQAGVELQL